MTVSERTEYITRDTILKLLSDDEIAKVSNAETVLQLAEGAEYLDLEELDKGVQLSRAGTRLTIPHALPRAVVGPATWDAILAQLAK
jgi:TusA-related sulfurtransferase